jgi:hypothetical protein
MFRRIVNGISPAKTYNTQMLQAITISGACMRMLFFRRLTRSLCSTDLSASARYRLAIVIPCFRAQQPHELYYLLAFTALLCTQTAFRVMLESSRLSRTMTRGVETCVNVPWPAANHIGAIIDLRSSEASLAIDLSIVMPNNSDGYRSETRPMIHCRSVFFEEG